MRRWRVRGGISILGGWQKLAALSSIERANPKRKLHRQTSKSHFIAHHPSTSLLITSHLSDSHLAYLCHRPDQSYSSLNHLSFPMMESFLLATDALTRHLPPQGDGRVHLRPAFFCITLIVHSIPIRDIPCVLGMKLWI